MRKGKTTGASQQIFTISGVCLQRLAAAYKRNQLNEEQTLKGIWTGLRFAPSEVGLFLCNEFGSQYNMVGGWGGRSPPLAATRGDRGSEWGASAGRGAARWHCRQLTLVVSGCHLVSKNSRRKPFPVVCWANNDEACGCHPPSLEALLCSLGRCHPSASSSCCH